LAAVCVMSLAYVGLQYFGTSPLPDRVTSASYGLDSVWNLSLAAEAKHHWPIADPTVSGTSLTYHLFATFDVAATSQVTGLSLPPANHGAARSAALRLRRGKGHDPSRTPRRIGPVRGVADCAPAARAPTGPRRALPDRVRVRALGDPHLQRRRRLWPGAGS